MQFFQNFPKTSYQGKVLTDICSRFDFSSLNWTKSPALYYNYTYQDIDTLDNIADRYYEDSSLHWIIVLTNGLLNPQFDLPLDPISFEYYIDDKYKTEGEKLGISGLRYASLTPDPVYAYQKLITIKNITKNRNMSMDYIILDKKSYDNIEEFETVFTEGYEDFSYTVSKRSVFSILDKERDDNETKRNIKILKKDYVQNIISSVNSLIETSK